MTNYTPMPTRRPPQPKTYPVCSLKKAMDIIKSKCGDVYVKERHGKGSNKVIILPESEQELNSIISYGRRSPMNVYPSNPSFWIGGIFYALDSAFGSSARQKPPI